MASVITNAVSVAAAKTTNVTTATGSSVGATTESINFTCSLSIVMCIHATRERNA